MSGHLFLIGFMGAGKTTVGLILADKLGRRFLDMDAAIEDRLGMPIREIFYIVGEENFRRTETTMLKKLSSRQGLVVATGGGVPERLENRELMGRSGRMIHLEADFDHCLARLNPDDLDQRPLWQNLERARQLYDRRKAYYSQADISVPTDGVSPEQVVNEIMDRLIPEDGFSLCLGDHESKIAVSRQGPQVLSDLVSGRPAAILTDRRVAELHLAGYADRLPGAPILALPGGERIKTIETARQVWSWLLTNHIPRDGVLIALGGGTVTDLGAFVAANYKRGMDSVLVATTLLGGVDAAVGGKAAINLGGAKNAIGCFTTPSGVILDLEAMKTLAPAQIKEGLIEAYKTGLVACPELAAIIEGGFRSILAKDSLSLAEVVRLSARTKAGVVADDFREETMSDDPGRRSRAILNLGHTFGHALEVWHDYRISHGRAVGFGLIVAVKLSVDRGWLSRDLAERIIATIGRFGLKPVAFPPVHEAWDIMKHDKKIRQGRLIFVLLKDIGRPEIVDDVTERELAEVLKEK